MRKMDKNDHKSVVGSWIAEHRASRGWSRERLAAAVDRAAKTIERWEAGLHEVRGSDIMALEALFNDVAPRPAHGEQVSLDKDVPRGTSKAPDSLTPFGLAAARLRATDAEVAFLVAAVQTPEAQALAGNGSEPEFLASLLEWVRLRAGQRDAATAPRESHHGDPTAVRAIVDALKPLAETTSPAKAKGAR